MVKEWYSPAEIRYTRDHNIFILFNLESMKVGIYPPEPTETGYTDTQRRGISRHAHFEKACIHSAEISKRLKLTKTDGKLLKAQVQGGVTDYELLEPEAQMALNYISLFDFRKRPSYVQWCKRRRYYYGKEKRYQKVSNQNKRGNHK